MAKSSTQRGREFRARRKAERIKKILARRIGAEKFMNVPGAGTAVDQVWKFNPGQKIRLSSEENAGAKSYDYVATTKLDVCPDSKLKPFYDEAGVLRAKYEINNLKVCDQYETKLLAANTRIAELEQLIIKLAGKL
jgi:hypothetical protein